MTHICFLLSEKCEKMDNGNKRLISDNLQCQPPAMLSGLFSGPLLTRDIMWLAFSKLTLLSTTQVYKSTTRVYRWTLKLVWWTWIHKRLFFMEYLMYWNCNVHTYVNKYALNHMNGSKQKQQGKSIHYMHRYKTETLWLHHGN